MNKNKSQTAPPKHGHEKKLHSNLVLTVAITAFSAAILFSVVIAPLITYVNSDITITSYWADILDILLQLLHFVTFFSCYAATCFCIYKFPFKESAPIIAFFSAATVFKYSFNAISEIVFAKLLGFTLPDDAIQRAIFSITVQTVLELLQYAVIILVAFLIFKKHKAREATAKKISEKLNKPYNERNSVFPFKKIISFKNPLQKAALFSFFTVSFFRIITRLYYDISDILFFGGTITSPDILWMIASYTDDILFGFAGYFIMIFVFNKLDNKDLALQAKYIE